MRCSFFVMILHALALPRISTSFLPASHPVVLGACRRHRPLVSSCIINTNRRFVEHPQQHARWFSKTAVQLQQQHKYDFPITIHNTTSNHSVTILDRGEHYLVAAKPPTVLCHHSDWAGSRRKRKKNDNDEEGEEEEEPTPMLQRVRDAMGGQRVNVIHRLDRGCSGCLLFAFANTENEKNTTTTTVPNATAILSGALALESTQKTYLALVRGEGILHGRDFTKEGWFLVDRPIKDEKGRLNNATTYFRFLAGQSSLDNDPSRPRASLVLARPQTGKWHQIRRHLNGLSHPILGDSSHGNSKTNQEWRTLRGLPGERTCLHLAQLDMQPNPACPDGITANCPLPPDMMKMLTQYLPDVLEKALPLLQEEGISLT